MAIGKNKLKVRKGRKKAIEPMTRKDWYDVQVPATFHVRKVGKTLVNRTSGLSTSLVLVLITFDFYFLYLWDAWSQRNAVRCLLPTIVYGVGVGADGTKLILFVMLSTLHLHHRVLPACGPSCLVRLFAVSLMNRGVWMDGLGCCVDDVAFLDSLNLGVTCRVMHLLSISVSYFAVVYLCSSQ